MSFGKSPKWESVAGSETGCRTGQLNGELGEQQKLTYRSGTRQSSFFCEGILANPTTRGSEGILANPTTRGSEGIRANPTTRGRNKSAVRLEAIARSHIELLGVS